MSQNAKYVGIFSVKEITMQGEKGMLGRGAWEIFDHRGKKVAENENPIIPDMSPNRIILSDAGSWVEIDNKDAIPWGERYGVTLHKLQGTEIQEIAIKETKTEEKGWDVNAAAISEDGRYFLIAATSRVENAEGRKEVLAYDEEGREVWKFIPAEQHYVYNPAILIFKDGSISVLCLEERSTERRGGYTGKSIVYILNKTGNVIITVSDILPVKIRLSNSGKYVVLLGSNRIILIDPKNGKTLFDQYSGTVMKDVDIAEKARLVVTFEGNQIVLRNLDGKKIWNVKPSNNGVGPFSTISISDDGREISLVVGNEFYLFERMF